MGRVKKPKCQDCGSGRCHAVLTDYGGHLWLCGSCEMLRNEPEAKLREHPDGLPGTWPKRGRGKPQKESLF